MKKLKGDILVDVAYDEAIEKKKQEAERLKNEMKGKTYTYLLNAGGLEFGGTCTVIDVFYCSDTINDNYDFFLYTIKDEVRGSTFTTNQHNLKLMEI